MLQQIIDPVKTELIEQELTPERWLRRTNKANNEIYVVDAHCAPHTMREIGRLREISFRASGGGTGKDCDIDEFDTMPSPCKQLLVWNPETREIIGAYRFLLGHDMTFTADGTPHIAMAHMFHFSDTFLNEYLPVSIELGRSFVRPEYQSTRAGVNAIFALDNLWDGLGALTVKYPQIKYLFGKMTMYPTYPLPCRDLLLRFLKIYFPDPDRFIWPIEPVEPKTEPEILENFFNGHDFKQDYNKLNAFVRNNNINIPPLVNAYMGLSPTMRMVGTAVNHEFGDVEETGIFFKIDEIADNKKSRHIETYNPHDI